MKRDVTTYPLVKKINPWFWKPCEFCKKEFRREKGYSVTEKMYCQPEYYCCNACSKDEENVKKMINKRERGPVVSAFAFVERNKAIKDMMIPPSPPSKKELKTAFDQPKDKEYEIDFNQFFNGEDDDYLTTKQLEEMFVMKKKNSSKS